jgi:hypothetical protein
MANVTNLGRFSDWDRWNYDWHLDVEPTLHEIAEQQGPGFMPGTLLDSPLPRQGVGAPASTAAIWSPHAGGG